jgi:hypothetical protein
MVMLVALAHTACTVCSPVSSVEFATDILEQRPWHFCRSQLDSEGRGLPQGRNHTGDNDRKEDVAIDERGGRQQGHFDSLFAPEDLVFLIANALETVSLESAVRWKPGSEEYNRVRESNSEESASVNFHTKAAPVLDTVEDALAVVERGHSLVLGLEKFPCKHPG